MAPGVIALVLALAAYGVGWLPGVGWLGLALGVASLALALLLLTTMRQRMAAEGYGAASLVVSICAMALGLAFQIKHARPGLDALIAPGAPWTLLAATGTLAVAGTLFLWIVRRSGPRVLLALSFAAWLTGVWCAAGTLTGLDRRLVDGPTSTRD